jgi:hypothetical protein
VSTDIDPALAARGYRLAARAADALHGGLAVICRAAAGAAIALSGFAERLDERAESLEDASTGDQEGPRGSASS